MILRMYGGSQFLLSTQFDRMEDKSFAELCIILLCSAHSTFVFRHSATNRGKYGLVSLRVIDKFANYLTEISSCRPQSCHMCKQ